MGLSPAKQLIYIERERVGVMRDPDMGTMFGPMLMRWVPTSRSANICRIVEQGIWCQGYSEPTLARFAGLQTTAVLDGDHYVINGSKIWTRRATGPPHVLPGARHKDAKKQEGITFFVLDDIAARRASPCGRSSTSPTTKSLRRST